MSILALPVLDGSDLLASGVSMPLWGLPILLVAVAGAAWYRKNRDADR